MTQSQPVRIHQIEECEIHFPGNNEYVCACWNLRPQKKTIQQEGLTYVAAVHLLEGKPYIDFVSLRQDGDEVWIDEDSPVEGGLNVAFGLFCSKTGSYSGDLA